MVQESLGQVFQRYRQEEKIKLDKVENDLKISKKVLIALENDDYKNLPDQVYSKNIIKTYAQYLSLDYNKLLALYQPPQEEKVAKNKNEQKVARFSKINFPQLAKIIIVVIIILSLVGYLGFKVKQMFDPPQLVVFEPAQDLIIEQNFITIKGQTEKEAQIYINDKEVAIDDQGQFNLSLDLQKGINDIKISAVKKHSRAQVIMRQVLVQ